MKLKMKELLYSQPATFASWQKHIQLNHKRNIPAIFQIHSKNLISKYNSLFSIEFRNTYSPSRIQTTST